MKKNILIIGPVCGPPGGVNVHIHRLTALLKSKFTITYIDESRHPEPGIFNIRSKKIFKYLAIIKNADFIHIHSPTWWIRCFHIFWGLFFRKKIVNTNHSWDEMVSVIGRQLTSYLQNKCYQNIVVNGIIADRLRLNGSKIIPAFLPPDMNNEADLPKNVLELLDKHQGRKLIVANAYELYTYQGHDLYGLDMCVDLALKFKQSGKAAFILYVIASLEKGRDLYEKNLSAVNDHKLENFIEIIPYQVPFVRLIQQSDLVLRPTCKDGDAITIREALWLNKPVIASDVVDRPEGTILFKTRDGNDLYGKVIQVFDMKGQQETGKFHRFEFKTEYFKIFQKE